MDKTDMEKILSQQIADLSQYIKENSSMTNAGDLARLHCQLESYISTYNKLFLENH